MHSTSKRAFESNMVAKLNTQRLDEEEINLLKSKNTGGELYSAWNELINNRAVHIGNYLAFCEIERALQEKAIPKGCKSLVLPTFEEIVAVATLSKLIVMKRNRKPQEFFDYKDLLRTYQPLPYYRRIDDLSNGNIKKTDW